MAVADLQGFMSMSYPMQSTRHNMFLSSPFIGQKGGIGYPYSSDSGIQIGKINFPRKMLSTTRRFLTTSVLADVTKDFTVVLIFCGLLNLKFMLFR